MAYAKTDEEGRILDYVDDANVAGLDDEGRAYIETLFPAYFGNEGIIGEHVHYTNRDFRIEGDAAVFDPLPESLEAMARADIMENAPEHMVSTDDAICELYEQTLAQSDIIDQQDAAICALYEMIGE